MNIKQFCQKLSKGVKMQCYNCGKDINLKPEDEEVPCKGCESVYPATTIIRLILDLEVIRENETRFKGGGTA